MSRYYIPAQSNELQVDLDKTPMREFNKRLGILRGIDEVKVLDVQRVQSKTAGHWHITIKLDRELSEVERIALQACLGSDPVRELLSWARVRKGDAAPILFMEPVKRFHANEYEDLDDLEPGDVRDSDFLASEPYPDRAVYECEHELGMGRCEHMDEFQPTLTLVQYGGAK